MPIVKSITDLGFAYEGYQYPLPPSWKYAIRQQDQIIWLYNAIAYAWENSANTDDIATLDAKLSAAIKEAELSANNYTDQKSAVLDAKISEVYNELLSIINETTGGARWVDPITGLVDNAQNIDKKLYDIARPYGCTYTQLEAHYTSQDYADVTSTFSPYTYMNVDVLTAALCGIILIDNLKWLVSQAQLFPISK